MNSNGSIGQYGFRAGGSDYYFTIAIGKGVTQVVQLPLLLAVYYLFIAYNGLALWVPVYHAHAPVNQSFFVEIDKNLNHLLVIAVFKGKAGAVPIATGPKLPQLLQDDSAIFFFPFPGILQKFFSGNIVFFNAFIF